ncbi:MAG TPA: ABC transporter permease [Acidothermaceae bacterium]|jgi:ABC-2 type transport system permease protein
MNLTYLRYELVRSVRNKRAFIFSLIFPLVLFYAVAGANRHIQLEGIPFPTYYLAGMASFGTMVAMTSVGARIAAERQAGWNRQLRLTPLTTRAYLRAKVLTGYLTALITIILLFIAGATLGVHLTPTNVLHMTELVLIGLIPFAALGIWIGHLFTPDSIGPFIGGGISLLALLGGAYTPIATHGALHVIAQATPTYWLVQAGHTLAGQPSWSAKGWITVAAWAVGLSVLAARAFRRDTARV